MIVTKLKKSLEYHKSYKNLERLDSHKSHKSQYNCKNQDRPSDIDI